MLKRPQRRLPARFNRRVKSSTLSFVKRRHQRVGKRKLDRTRRNVRRLSTFATTAWRAVRRWSLLLLTFTFLVLVGFIVFSPIIQVREIRVQRSEGRVDVARIQQSLAGYFGRHLLFLPASEIRLAVRQAVPDLQDVIVHKQYPSRLFLRIELKPLIALLKIEGPAGSGATIKRGTGSTATDANPIAPAEVRRYDYLTENGIYVSTAAAQSGSSLPLISVVDWPVRPVPNTQLVTPEFLERMHGAEKALTEEFGQKLVARTILIRAQEFHLKAGSITLWFDSRTPLEEQLQRYRTFLRNVPTAQVTQYVDLRLSGRVVYK